MSLSLRVLPDKLIGFLQRVGYAPQTFRLVWAAAGNWFVLWNCLLAIQGILPVFSAYLLKHLVEALTQGSMTTSGSIRQVLTALAMLFGLFLLMDLLRNASAFAAAVQGDLLRDHVADLVNQKATTVSLQYYELPEFYDHLHRAQLEAVHRPSAVLESMGSLLQHLITLFAICVVLIPFGWWVPLVLLGSTLPAFGAVLLYSVRQHEWRRRTTTLDRRSRYLGWLMSFPEAASEIRLLSLGPVFRDGFNSIRSRLRRESRRLVATQAVVDSAASGVGITVTALVLAWMLWRTSTSPEGLGNLAFLYQAFNQGQRMMNALLRQVGQLYYNSLFLGDLFYFLELEGMDEGSATPPAVPISGYGDEAAQAIRFENVTFAYGNHRRDVLKNFNLLLPAGKTTALIGRNGCGKSTVAKLACGLYQPREGKIFIGNTPIDGLDPREVRSRFTLVPQRPFRFNDTVRDNIRFGRVGDRCGNGRVEASASAAGAIEFIQELPDSYDQLLGRWFPEGWELSDGQWQRLALARAFYRSTPLVILDEPTSALDPWGEIGWFQRVRELSRNRTTLLITHNMTVARLADLIQVMDAGKIVEAGSHDELLAKRGMYAQLWSEQQQQV